MKDPDLIFQAKNKTEVKNIASKALMVLGIIILLIGLAAAAGYAGITAPTSYVAGIILIIIGLVVAWKGKK